MRRMLGEGRLKAPVLQSARAWVRRHPARAMGILTGGAVIVVIVATVTLLWNLRGRELDHAQSQIISLSRVLAEQTVRSMDGVDLVLSGIQDRLGDEIGQKLELDNPVIHLLLRSRVAGLPQIASVFVVDAQGNVTASSRSREVRSPPVSEREYFTAWRDGRAVGLFVSRPVRNMIDDRWTLHLSRRLSGPDGAFRGVVVANVDLGYFESLYASIQLDFVSAISLYLRDGTLVMSQPREESAVGRMVADLRSLDRAEDGEEEASVVDPGSGRLVAFRAVHKFPLVVGVAIDRREALEPWASIAWPIGIGTLLVALAISLGGGLLARELQREEALVHALSESDERLQATVQSLNDAVITVNREERITLFNQAAEKMFGRASADVIGHPLRDVLPQHAIELLRRHVASSRRAGGTRSRVGSGSVSIDCRHVDGREFPVEATVSHVSVGGERLLTAILRDVSERREAETQLRDSNRQLRELSVALQNVRETERRRIARELHDELGQKLTGLKLELSWLSGRVKKSQPEIIEKIEALKVLVSDTVEEARRISSELRPLMLDDLGFAAAAEWTIQDFARRTGIRTNFDLAGAHAVTGDPLATALFRILQESLTNIVRHAQATEVDISLHLRDGDVILRVRDNGRGMAASSKGKRGGFGLIGIRERAIALGGFVAHSTAEWEGFFIEVRVPLATTGSPSGEGDEAV